MGTRMTEEIISAVGRLRATGSSVIIAIDGRCASGKTTLAGELSACLGCEVIHTDDFFLRPGQRTTERYAEPGGNFDRERFLSEVLVPLWNGKPFSYRPFDCHTMSLSAPVTVVPGEVTVIEGTYSLHPDLCDFYDLRVFLDVPHEEQLRRLKERAPDKLDAFVQKWIPLEELYFSKLRVFEKCELKFV